MKKTIIGIDPGTKTGIAVYSPTDRKITYCATVGIVKAMQIVMAYIDVNFPPVELIFEDARKRRWIPKKTGRERLQGAGSIKRDSSIWQEFCEFHHISYSAVPPKAGMTKINSDIFRKITGWTGRTSEHSRDAAMIVFGR